MNLQLDRESRLPAYVQIRNQLRERILRGDLPPGTRLPPEREMARRLGVSRTTVVSAYDELEAEGLVTAHVGRGTVVVGLTSPLQGEAGVIQPIAWPAHFSALGQRVRESQTAELLMVCQLSNRPGITSLATGLPDSTLMPVDRLRQAWEAVLDRVGTDAVGCCPPQGIVAPLRELIATRLARYGISADPEGIAVISGARQGLDLLLRLLTEPGDAVITEAPTYFGALQAFRTQGLRVLCVPLDRDGMEVERVEFLLARYRPRLIYTVPTYQNPTGATMSLKRRERLLALAQQYQVPIVEVDPFSELYFDEPPPPPIKALDHCGHVLYLGTFSKCLSPGIRVGWLAAPQPMVELAIQLKVLADLHTNTMGQYLMVEFAQRGWLDEHVAMVRATYAARCQAMDAALRRHLPRSAKWNTPGGGLFLWLELPEQVTAHDLLIETGRRGVAFLPGHLLYPANGRRNVCRLNFSATDQETIERGVAVLGSALRQLMRRRAETPAEQTTVSPIV